MAFLKRIATATLLLLAIACTRAAADTKALDGFGYLNTNESAAIIDDSDSQDMVNVDVTPNGKSIKKRSGYGLYKTLSGSSALHGGYHFYDSSGNDVQIWASSTSLWGIVGDGTPTQLVSTTTAGSTWDCADSAGFAYCANTSRNVLLRTSGSSIVWSTATLGTMVTMTPLRLVVAGVSGNANTLYFSEANNFLNFTVGLTALSPFTEVIGAQGSRITNIEYACGKVLWWKDQSFGYVLGSEDQSNVEVVTVSNTVGSQDNSTAVAPDGTVHFRAQDGHFYKYDCANLQKLSVNIAPNIQTSAQRTSNSWTLSSVSDFTAGNIVSSITVNGSGVQISTTNTNFTDNSFENSLWSITAPNGVFNQSTPFVVGDNCGSVTPLDGSKVAYGQSNSANITVSLIDSSSNTYAGNILTFVNNNCSSWGTGNIYSSTMPVKTNALLRFTSTIGGPTINMDSRAFAWSGSTITYRWKSDKVSGVNTFIFDMVLNGASTLTEGIYYSPVRNAANLTSWDTFNVTKQDGGGTQAFFMRSSTTTFSILSSTPSWQAITAGSVISVSTGTYFQYKDSFTVVSATNTPVLQNSTINWFEGTASDKAYAVYFDNAIWWSVTYGAGQTTNNYIFRYDLLRQGWGLYDFGANGLAIQNNHLYFGSTAANGRIYRFGNTTDDNGSAISAYWKSKDFAGNDPWLDNEYTQLDTIATRNANQALTVTYTLSNSSSTAYAVSLSSSTDSIIRNKKLLPTGKIGGLLNVKFSDSSTTSSWEVLGFRFMYRPLPYKPTQ